MVRTRSNCSGFRVGQKASFKYGSSSTSSSTAKSTKKYGSGNKYCPRETPVWQKEITQFFNVVQNSSNSGEGTSSSACNEDDDS